MNPMLVQLLKNSGQGALNGAADMVSGPVNGIADKAKMAGINPANIPGSGAWMGQQGITAPATGFGGDFGKMLGGMAIQSIMGQKPNLQNGLLALAGGYALNKLFEAKPWEKWGKNE